MRGHFLRAALADSAAAYDADAQAYITAVEAADVASLEAAVKDAINDFVVGCKADGIWTAIKAACILAGARTLAGALVPLVGVAPTSNNFVSGDYNRKTGLIGNASTKSLLANRNNNADPQNNFSMTIYISTASPTPAVTQIYITGETGSNIGIFGSNIFCRNRTTSFANLAASTATGFVGTSRSASGSYSCRASGSTTTVSVASESPGSNPIWVYQQANGNFTDARFAFYSIGESLSLASLDSRLTTLINAYAAAIP